MLPLGGAFELHHVINRVKSATEVDEVVVATSTKNSDDIVAWGADEAGTSVFRGDEENVLQRVHGAARSVNASEIVRITADCPLIEPRVIDAVVLQRRETCGDYATNVLNRTFPRGLDVEVFSMGSFSDVLAGATTPAHREHVTLYYREHPSEFDLTNVPSVDVFDQEQLQNRTDLRLTLDELDDYKLLYQVFESLEYELTPSFKEAVRYIDEYGLRTVNQDVTQKSPTDASGH
jgi:spore coat polysaccharide biosynthesis protein SpsF